MHLELKWIIAITDIHAIIKSVVFPGRIFQKKTLNRPARDPRVKKCAHTAHMLVLHICVKLPCAGSERASAASHGGWEHGNDTASMRQAIVSVCGM